MRKAACIARDQLLSFGTCLGKFTKSGKFHLHITALDYLAPYAKVGGISDEQIRTNSFSVQSVGETERRTAISLW